MKLDYLTPMLWTSDLKASIQFYTEVLGFQLDTHSEEWQWCHLHKDKVCLMLNSSSPAHAPNEGKALCTGSFYIYTDDVDALWNKLKSTTTVSYPIGNFPHKMREFAILDNNGYMLQFGRELRADETIDECD